MEFIRRVLFIILSVSASNISHVNEQTKPKNLFINKVYTKGLSGLKTEYQPMSGNGTLNGTNFLIDLLNITDEEGSARDAVILECPYVVSIIHKKLSIHICTGILVTTMAVLTYIRCVVRRTTSVSKDSFMMPNPGLLAVMAGMDFMDPTSPNVFLREVDGYVTPYKSLGEGSLLLLVIKRVPVTQHHHPIKLYSTDSKVLNSKLDEYIKKGFCTVYNWEDTIICSKSIVLRPKRLQAFRVKLVSSAMCEDQTMRLQNDNTMEWTKASTSDHKKHCFASGGGERCGSSPGAPVVCGNAVYGITSIGTSCTEFGDFTYFVPLSGPDLKRLFELNTRARGRGIKMRAFDTKLCIILIFAVVLSTFAK